LTPGVNAINNSFWKIFRRSLNVAALRNFKNSFHLKNALAFSLRCKIFEKTDGFIL